jgi:hypothetical protein
VAVLGDSTEGDVRTLRLRLTSPRGTSEMTTVVTTPGEVVGAAVDGRPVSLDDYAPAREGEFALVYANVPAGGWELDLVLRSAGPVTIEVEEATDGLPHAPGMAIAPRPADTMPSMLYPRDATVITRTFRY